MGKIERKANDTRIARRKIEKNVGRRQPLINGRARAFPKATTSVNKVQRTGELSLALTCVQTLKVAPPRTVNSASRPMEN